MQIRQIFLIFVSTLVFGVSAETAEADQGKAIVGATVVDLYGNQPIEDPIE